MIWYGYDMHYIRGAAVRALPPFLSRIHAATGFTPPRHFAAPGYCSSDDTRSHLPPPTAPRSRGRRGARPPWRSVIVVHPRFP